MAKKTQTGSTAADGVFRSLCRTHGLPDPTPEYAFHPTRKWRFDWAWPEGDADRPPVALEIEGEVFGRGRACPACGRRAGGAHSSVRNLLDDMEKYNEAAILGWVVIRVLPKDVDSGAAFDLLKRVLL